MPPPFLGCPKAQDPDSWLKYFERYTNYKHLSEHRKADLFKLLMQKNAGDWIDTLEPDKSYVDLVQLFRQRFQKSAILKYKIGKELFQRRQRPDETVDDFYTALQIRVHSLDNTSNETCDELVKCAFLSGLQDRYANYVIARHPDTLTAILEAAREAELILADTPDQEMLKSLIIEVKRQCLESKTTAVTPRSPTPERRQVRFSSHTLSRSPQQQTRRSSNQNSTNLRSSSGPVQSRQNRSSSAQSQTPIRCKFCCLTHAPRQCPAYGKQCRQCNGFNHFARSHRRDQRPWQSKRSD